MPYQANQLADCLYAIDEGMVRSFLLTGGEQAILVDTGASGEALRDFCETLTDSPITVLITHADVDHTAALSQFDRVYMHPDDFERYKKAGAPLAMRHGDCFLCGTGTLEVLHIPGHTPGSCALFCREGRFLLAGDSVSRAPIFMFGEGRSFPEYIASMEKLADLIPCIDVVFAAHGPATVPPALIRELLDGARAYLAGDLAGEDPQSPFPIPAKAYRYAEIAFLA